MQRTGRLHSLNQEQLLKLTAEQQQNASILLAALNYSIAHHTGQLVFDDRDHQKEFYLEEIKKTEVDITLVRADRIKKRLDKHLKMLKYQLDYNFNNYIKTKTGYDIDIYEEFKTKVVPIISGKAITEEDFFYITCYLNAYSKNLLEKENVDILMLMSKEYEATHLTDPEEEEIELLSISVTCQLSDSGEQKTVDGQVTSKIMTKEAYEVYQLNQPKFPVDYAPNGINEVSVENHGEGEFASTSVRISLSNGGGGIYLARGENLSIKAYWKDDYTVVIETKNEYESIQKCKQVISTGEVYTIEYVEAD